MTDVVPTVAAPSSGMRYSKPLDGIRGLAILGVVLLHYSWVSAGWIGVQVFFVLSGYLITSILVGDRDLPAPAYFKRFYWRRSLRIFPLYFAYLTVLTVSHVTIGISPGLERQLPYLFTYTHNFWFLVTDGSRSGFTFHLWSLSVEEQFYLLWPLVVLVFSPAAFRRLVIAIMVLGPLVRLASVLLVDTFTNVPDPSLAAIRLTFCQFDAFATGAAVALFGTALARFGFRTFLMATAVLLALGQAQSIVSTGSLALNTALGYREGMSQGFQYVWGYSAINLWAGVMIAAALRTNLLSLALSWTPLVYVGRVSYGMYVLHLAVLRGVNGVLGDRHGLENAGKFVVYLAALVAVCAISFRWFETPFLRLKDRYFVRS